jgi:hypothetical protein
VFLRDSDAAAAVTARLLERVFLRDSDAAAAVTARLLELAADNDSTALGDLLAVHPSLADEPTP